MSLWGRGRLAPRSGRGGRSGTRCWHHVLGWWWRRRSHDATFRRGSRRMPRQRLLAKKRNLQNSCIRTTHARFVFISVCKNFSASVRGAQCANKLPAQQLTQHTVTSAGSGGDGHVSESAGRSGCGAALGSSPRLVAPPRVRSTSRIIAISQLIFSSRRVSCLQSKPRVESAFTPIKTTCSNCNQNHTQYLSVCTKATKQSVLTHAELKGSLDSRRLSPLVQATRATCLVSWSSLLSRWSGARPVARSGAPGRSAAVATAVCAASSNWE